MIGDAYLCMEKMETCFAKIISLCTKFDVLVPTKVVATVCHSVASVICFLKEHKTIHRDIKPGFKKSAAGFNP